MNDNSSKSINRPVVVFYDLNPIAMLDLELSLREVLGQAAELYPLTIAADVAQVVSLPSVVLFLLDGKLNVSSYAPLNAEDERLYFLSDRPDAAKKQIERRPSAFALRKIPALSRLISSS